MRHESIALHKIVLPSRLHRVTIDEEALHQLMASIERDGLINSISVTEMGDVFQLEAGHRRFLAHQRMRRTHIDAKIYDAADKASGESIRFAENLNRADLSPMEEATALEGAMREGQMTIEQIASMVSRSTTWVEQRLDLVTLPLELAEHVHTRRLSIAAALELQKVEDDEHRAYLLRYTLDAGATIPVVREWVNQWMLARAAGNAAIAPRPDMPTPGQPIIIQIPCYVCNTPLAHDKLRILRICPACTHELAGAGDAHQPHHPPPTTSTAPAET
jgi:ParB family chromosome partitioning protein